MCFHISEYFLGDDLSQTHLSASLQLHDKLPSNKSVFGNNESGVRLRRSSYASPSPDPRRNLSHGSRSSLSGSVSEKQLKQSSKGSISSQGSTSSSGKVSARDQEKGRLLTRRSSVRAKPTRQASKRDLVGVTPDASSESHDLKEQSRESPVKTKRSPVKSRKDSMTETKLEEQSDNQSTADSGLGRGSRQNKSSSSSKSGSVTSLRARKSDSRISSRHQSSRNKYRDRGRDKIHVHTRLMHVRCSQWSATIREHEVHLVISPVMSLVVHQREHHPEWSFVT